jgi:hypothetical protein
LVRVHLAARQRRWLTLSQGLFKFTKQPLSSNVAMHINKRRAFFTLVILTTYPATDGFGYNFHYQNKDGQARHASLSNIKIIYTIEQTLILQQNYRGKTL